MKGKCMSDAPISNSAPAAAPQAAQQTQSASLESQESNETSAAPEGQAGGAPQAALTPEETAKLAQAKEKVTKEIAKKLKKFKIKVDGREYDEELPFELDDTPENRKYMERQAQMAKMGSKRAQEKADLEKQVQEFINELKKNPRKILESKELGLDMNKFVEEYINEQIANSKKSPHEIEKERLEAELRTMKEEREKEKQELQQKEFERLQEQEFERYDMLMSKALEATDLPKSPYVVKKMADYMLLGLQQGLNVTPEDVLPLVREEIQNDISEMFNVMPEEVIEKILGDGVVNKLRKRRIAKAQVPPTPLKSAVKDTGKTKGSEAASAAKPESYKKFFGF
jgi:hypothetical protein